MDFFLSAALRVSQCLDYTTRGEQAMADWCIATHSQLAAAPEIFIFLLLN